MHPRVLITGATGLLGQSLVRTFQPHFETFGWSRQISKNRIFKVDLTHPTQMIDALDSLPPQIVIHTAAAKDPDFCFQNPEEAKLVNEVATQKISEWCFKKECKLVFISTDSVFDGLTPLYREDADRHPVNFYGITKMRGENAVLKAERNLVIRLPLLYGPDAKPGYDLIEKLKTKIVHSFKEGHPLSLDGQSVRTPTHVDDVSEALLKLAPSSVHGIFHLRGPNRMTYVHMAHTIAHVFGMHTDHFVSSPVFPTLCPRPLDPSMSIDLCLNNRLSMFRSFKVGVEEIAK